MPCRAVDTMSVNRKTESRRRDVVVNVRWFTVLESANYFISVCLGEVFRDVVIPDALTDCCRYACDHAMNLLAGKLGVNR